MITEVEELIKNENYEKKSLSKSNELADALIWLLLNGKRRNDVDVINIALLNAFMHCFNKKGEKYAAARGQRSDIVDGIKQILGWMVLSSINENELMKLVSTAVNEQGLYFELPVQTLGGVEVIVSRHSERYANFASIGSEVTGKYLLDVTSRNFQWKDSATVSELKKMLWNQVFPEEKQDDSLSIHQTRTLNSALYARRTDKWSKEHHFIAFCSDIVTGEDEYKSLYKDLLTELDNLTLVRFGIDNAESTFYLIDEYQLMGVINHLLNTINRMK